MPSTLPKEGALDKELIELRMLDLQMSLKQCHQLWKTFPTSWTPIRTAAKTQILIWCHLRPVTLILPAKSIHRV